MDSLQNKSQRSDSLQDESQRMNSLQDESHPPVPHKSYFLSGKAAGLTMLYLVDTRRNTNLVSKQIFNK